MPHGPFLVILALCCQTLLTACSRMHDALQADVSAIAHQVWAYSHSHPDGFTLHVPSLTQPAEGLAVSYAATQHSHSRRTLQRVIRHALTTGGYVGGWYNLSDSLYYFDSTRLFPEDSLCAALQFGKANGQLAVHQLSTQTDIPLHGTVAKILQRGRIIIGTTADYRPLSFLHPQTGCYTGFCVDLARAIAQKLGVEAEFVNTSWPTLTQDVMASPPRFDLAIGGITITAHRKALMLMSEGYLHNGKTILCRAQDSTRFQSLADINQPGVRVMVNPGGLNEQFAHDSLAHATIIVHHANLDIPALVAAGKADVMITEITEAPYYVHADPRLAAPLLNRPFTKGQIGILMPPGQDDLLGIVNGIIRRMKADGSLSRLKKQYGLL